MIMSEMWMMIVKMIVRLGLGFQVYQRVQDLL